MEIYITKHGQQIGPFSEEEVRERLESGNAKGMDLAWCEGRSDWVPLSQILSIVPDPIQQSPLGGLCPELDTKDLAIEKQQIDDGFVIKNMSGPPPLRPQKFEKAEQAPLFKATANQSVSVFITAEASKGEGLVKPRTRPRSIGWVTFLAFIWPGLGQLLCGQSTKGGVLMLVCLITCGLASATAIIPLAICILSAIDARKVATQLANQKAVGVWEFFPRDG